MAITRLWQAGFETGSTDELSNEVGNNTVITTNPYTGTYHLRVIKGTGVDYVIQNVPATRQLRTGFAVGGLYNGIFCDHVTFNPGNLAAISWDSMATGEMRLFVSDVEQDNYFGISESFCHIGIDVNIHPATGWIYVYRNGVEVMSFTGNTGDADIEQVYYGDMVDTGGGTLDFDDMYIDDTTGESSPAAPPILRFAHLKPNGLGNYAQWSKSSGSDGYDLVDEVPPSDADYIQSDAVGEKESHNMETYTLGANEECKAIIPIVRAAKTGVAETIKLGTRLSTTDLLGSEQQLPTSAGYLFERQVSPPGGGDWEQADIDAFEILIESSGSF